MHLLHSSVSIPCKKSHGEEGEFCAYKLDLVKTYDRVDWRSLEGILLRLAFIDNGFSGF